MARSGEVRDLGLNAARGVAVLLILVAQTAPGAGPFQLLMLSEFVPPALLAVLIGMTAQVARDHGAGPLVNVLWGVALVGFGGLISLVPSQVVGILGYLGCLAVLTGVLVRLSVGALLALGVVLLALTPWLTVQVADLRSGGALQASWVGRLLLESLEVLAGASPYRLLALALYAVAGVLLTRMVASSHTHGMVVGGAAVIAMGFNAVDQVGGPELHPMSGSAQVLAFNTAVAVAVAAAGHWAGSRSGGATGVLTETLADVGGMWLSVYVLMILGTAAHLWVDPLGGHDRSWQALVWTVAAAVLISGVWIRLLAGTRLEQGPIEGVLETLAGREPTLRRASLAAVEPGPQSLRSRT